MKFSNGETVGYWSEIFEINRVGKPILDRTFHFEDPLRLARKVGDRV